MTIPTADCAPPTRGTPPDDTTGRGGPMNDKIRAWVDAQRHPSATAAPLPTLAESRVRYVRPLPASERTR